MIMRAYIDIDNVILIKDGKQMPYLKEFLDILSTIFDGNVFILSTLCRSGDTSLLIEHFDRVLERDIFYRLKFMKVVNWEDLRTDAIDFRHKVYWFTNRISGDEEKILCQKDKLDCWRKVDNNLKEIVENLEKEFPQYHRNRGKYFKVIQGALY